MARRSLAAPRVVVIGGGISGLSAGIYARLCGFPATVLEKNSYPGGACAVWTRSGYAIEGSMHYLTGVSPGNPMHRVWREVGALNDHSLFHQPDPFLVCQHSGKRYCLYRSTDVLQEHLISQAPEDAAAIRSFVSDIKKFTPFPSPFIDVSGVPISGPTASALSFGLKMLPIIPRFAKLSTVSAREYAAQFKNRGIRELIMNIADEYFSAGSLMYVLSSISLGDLAYVRGGSAGVARGMAARLVELGGSIEYGQKVDGILREGSKIVGVKVGERQFDADAVVATIDAREVADKGFVGTSLKEPWMAGFVASMKPVIADMIAIGVKTSLPNYPYQTIFPFEEPLPSPYNPSRAIKVLNYNGMADAPSGCCVLTALLHGTEGLFEYWTKAAANGEYEAKKKELVSQITEKVEKAMPEIKGKIEFAELTTSLTMQKYLGNYKGSYMSYHWPYWNIAGGFIRNDQRF
jgi:phytoene dehydrogenase-like protein